MNRRAIHGVCASLPLLMVMLLGMIQTAAAQEGLPERLHTVIDKTLDDQFAEIEKALIRDGRLEAQDVLLVTVPLENYIEDVLFTINRPAVIYPRRVYDFILEQFRAGRPRHEIEAMLVDLQKHNGFAKLGRGNGR